MKIKIFKYNLMILSLLILSSSVLYPQDKNRPFPEIDLMDTDMSFPVLGSLFKSGYFNNISGKVNYAQRDNSGKPRDGVLALQSGLVKRDQKVFSVFTLYSSNTLNQSVRFIWETERDDDVDSVRDDSISKIMDFALESKNRDFNKSLMESPIWSQDVTGFKALYSDVKEGTFIKGYEIDFNTVPSSTTRFWRALGELTFFNCIGIANYWIAKDENMEDWEYQPDSAGIKKKIMDGWSLDTNAFRTNTIYHIYAGVVYYQTGRSNGYGYFGSTVWAFTGSLLWEYIGEFREQVSTNDMIFTTMGGVLLGEAFRLSSIYLERNMSPGIFRGLFVFLLDPMRKINDALNRCSGRSVRVNLLFLNPAQMILEEAKAGGLRW